MFEKFFGKQPAEQESQESRRARYAKDERERLNKLPSYGVEADLSKDLGQLIESFGFAEVDPRINADNFPGLEREQHYQAKIINSLRDGGIEDFKDYLNQNGLRSATVYELIEFLAKNSSEIVAEGEKLRLYALGSILEEGDNKFVVNIAREDGKYSLLLKMLSEELLNGQKFFYAPWPAAVLTVLQDKSESGGV